MKRIIKRVTEEWIDTRPERRGATGDAEDLDQDGAEDLDQDGAEDLDEDEPKRSRRRR